WTCTASAGGTCQSASGSGNISTTTNSIAGSSGTLTFNATCTLSTSATGSLVNSANNSATDTDTINARADLSITKTDGITTVLAGASPTYTIKVTNPATVAVTNVAVADTFPAALTGCAWTCVASGTGACESASGSGNIATTANTIAGSSGTLTFSATCTVSGTATGSLVNSASVAYGNDINAANNSATDTDTITPLADLSITNTNGLTAVNAGSSVTYTITATNPSANTVSPVTVTDTFPAILSVCNWTCAASSGSTCQTASGVGNIGTSTNSIAANGGTLTFSATCTLSSTSTGSVADTANVSYANDGNAANNSATDTDTIVPRADLSVTNTDGVSSLKAGSNTTYTIVVNNGSTPAASSVSVTDAFPAGLSACTWTCTPTAGGTCESASGSGDIATTANTIAGGNGKLTFSATCTLASGAIGSLANIASAAYANDSNSSNNSATDTDTIVPSADLSV